MKQMILSSKIKGGVLSDHFFMLWFQKEKRERIWPKEEKKNGKEKKKNIWRKEIYGPQRRKEWRGKRRKIFGEGKYLVHGGEKEQRQKRRNIFGEIKCLEKENTWSAKEKRMEKENEEIIKRRKIDGDIEGPTGWM